MTGPQPGEKRRFLLELWLEPRTVVSHLFRLRGDMSDLETHTKASVGGLKDVDDFIQQSFAAPGREVRWEIEQ